MTVRALRVAATGAAPAGGVFERIGRFLAEHRLSPEPAHYSFAYHVLSAPDGALAQAVARITDGGVRLSSGDIAQLGGEAVAGAPVDLAAQPATATVPAADDPRHEAEVLIARTSFQVDGFADTVRAIQAGTSDFGRDLVASAAAIRDASEDSTTSRAIDEIARITGEMIERVRAAEVELASAYRETDSLRSALEAALGSARQDPLTELANRRAFDEAFAGIPHATTVCVGVFDIDHFKRVNDEFGHGLGDRVLKAVGQTLATECAGHLVVRYGGEEFAVLMVDVDLDTAWATLDRARSAVAARRFRSRDNDVPLGSITISAGVAVGNAYGKKDQMMELADGALYRAKAAGRNRVFRAPEVGA